MFDPSVGNKATQRRGHKQQCHYAIAKALNEVRDTRVKFRTVTEAQAQQRKAAPNVDVEM